MEYQIEALHIHGDKHPHTGLKNKVKRWQFKQTLDIIDPITFEMTKQPLKPFMVTQLQIAFEREMMILSPFDEILHKQLIDYSVEKISQSGQPVFTSENEHFVDALGLSYLAMVLEFKELTSMMKDVQTTAKVEFSNKTIGGAGLNRMFSEAEASLGKTVNSFIPKNRDTSDRPGDRPTQFQIPLNFRNGNGKSGSWGSRSSGTRSGGGFERRTW